MKFHKKSTRILFGICLALAFMSIIYMMFSYVFLDVAIASSRLAGTWYAGEKKQLVEQLSTLDQAAADRFSARVDAGSIRALIAPHAGYAYSGDVAAAVYRLTATQERKKILVLAPVHNGSVQGIALTSDVVYTVPIGSVAIDTATVAKLAEHELFAYNDSIYAMEHSFEMQVPLIHYYLPHAQVVPLLVGALSVDQIHQVAAALSSVIDEQTLVVVSSDFTHYGTRYDYAPFDDHQQLRIQQLDSGALYRIEQQSVSAFMSYVQRTGATICGRLPIAILLALLELHALGDVEPRLIAYKTSAEATKKSADSVSYVGLLFTTQQRTSLPYDDQLTAYEKRSLLTMARSVLQQLFAKETPEDLLYPILTPATQAAQGVFVTLYKNGELRGCIGRTSSNQPLYKTTAQMVRASALQDSRFTPVTQDELADIRIEISVLTEPRSVASYKDIVLGKHGIILTRGGNNALFLPKVPGEFGWDLPTTLSQLSKKAGLSADAWKGDDVSYQVFESIDFGE